MADVQRCPLSQIRQVEIMEIIAIHGVVPALVVVALLMNSGPLLGAELKIENLVNTARDNDTVSINAAEAEAAIAHPSPEVTEEALEEMRRRFRELNPGAMDLNSLRPLDKTEARGVPEVVTDPAANGPFWSTGRLLFKKADGKTYRCTAQVTNDLTVILTAAHCVYNVATGRWNGPFVFQRAYDDGKTAQTIGWRCVSIFKAYFDPSTNYAYDYAFILTDRNAEKPALSLVTGNPVQEQLTAIGYPENYGQGRLLYKVAGTWSSVSGGIVTMTGNPMRSGNSGGAWFAKFREDGGSGDNLVISVNSHHLVGNTTDENGPVFTTDTVRLMDHVTGGKCM